MGHPTSQIHRKEQTSQNKVGEGDTYKKRNTKRINNKNNNNEILRKIIKTGHDASTVEVQHRHRMGQRTELYEPWIRLGFRPTFCVQCRQGKPTGLLQNKRQFLGYEMGKKKFRVQRVCVRMV